MIDCVCTGISMQDPQTELWHAADMFEAGNVYILAPNPNGMKEPYYSRQITMKDYWTRRGVWIVEKKDAVLNEAAADHLRRNAS